MASLAFRPIRFDIFRYSAKPLRSFLPQQSCFTTSRMKRQRTDTANNVGAATDQSSSDKQDKYDKDTHRAEADAQLAEHVDTAGSASTQDTHPTGKDDWKTRPPYQIHTKNDDFEVRHEGSCHCGKVKFQLSREKPLAAKFCHCTTCQVIHGAPFQWAAIFHKTDINFTNGHHDLAWYDSQAKSTEHHLPCKVGCAYCRTPIMDEGRNMILLFPTLVKFKNEKDRKLFEPTCHMFYPQRVVDIKDGKTKWTGLDNSSEEIKDADQ